MRYATRAAVGLFVLLLLVGAQQVGASRKVVYPAIQPGKLDISIVNHWTSGHVFHSFNGGVPQLTEQVVWSSSTRTYIVHLGEGGVK